jgi:DNA-directed RNA polymerase subunit RPC12/RpoP
MKKTKVWDLNSEIQCPECGNKSVRRKELIYIMAVFLFVQLLPIYGVLSQEELPGWAMKLDAWVISVFGVLFLGSLITTWGYENWRTKKSYKCRNCGHTFSIKKDLSKGMRVFLGVLVSTISLILVFSLVGVLLILSKQ